MTESHHSTSEASGAASSGSRPPRPVSAASAPIVGRNPQNDELEINWRKALPLVLLLACGSIVCCRAFGAGPKVPEKKSAVASTKATKPEPPTETVTLETPRASYGRTTLDPVEELEAEPEKPQAQPQPQPAPPTEPKRVASAPVDYDAATEIRFTPVDEEAGDLDDEAPPPARTVVLPLHTRLRAVLVSAINTAYPSAVTARLTEQVIVGNEVVLPAGTTFEGKADPDVQAKRVAVRFFAARLPSGDTVPIDAVAQEVDMQEGLLADREHKNRTQSRLSSVGIGALDAARGVAGTVTGGAIRGGARQASRELADAGRPRRTYEVHPSRELLVCLTADTAFPLAPLSPPDAAEEGQP